MRRGVRAGVLLALLAIGPVLAHSLSVAHVDITVPERGSTLEVELDLAIRDLALSLPLDADRDEQVTWGEVQAIREPLHASILSGLQFRSRGGPCRLVPGELAIRHYDDGAYVATRLRAACPSPEGLEVMYGLLRDVDPQHRAIVTYRNAGATASAIAGAGPAWIPLGSGRGGAPAFVAFLRQGVHHILIGYDHLAFLLSLLLPVALVRVGGGWQPATGLRASLVQAVAVVSMFTVAHSITLSLAALGWVTPASRWVEVAIAASVMLAALANLRPSAAGRAWMMSFGFGLVHGFGFAGAMSELGLPTGSRVVALLGFNLGVEAGQLAIVVLVLPVLFLLGRRRWYAQWAMPAVSVGIACLALTWLVERIAG